MSNMLSIHSTFILWFENTCGIVKIPILHLPSILRPHVFFVNIAFGNNKMLSLNSNCSKLTFSIIL